MSADTKIRFYGTRHIIRKYEEIRDVLGSAELDPETGIFTPTRRIAAGPDLYAVFDLLRGEVMLSEDRNIAKAGVGERYVVHEGQVRIGYLTHDLVTDEPRVAYSPVMLPQRGLEQVLARHG